MIILDRLLIGGVKFILDKVASAADAELNDDTKLREELLATQMRLELGEITEAEFESTERAILARLREIRERREADAASEGEGPATFEVVGVESAIDTHEEIDPKPARRVARRGGRARGSR